MTTVAITGITGLAGGHVARALRPAGMTVVGISRRAIGTQAEIPVRTVPDLTDADALTAAFEGCDVVLHFADQADRKSYREEDVGTAAAALVAIRTAAMRNGIRRIVAASSVYADRPDGPVDHYGRSKRLMEAAAVAPAPGPQAMVLRLPPLYGPGARGAVRHIARACRKGWPLPFALARAPRRFLSLDALADLCVHLVGLEDTAFAQAAKHPLVPISARVGNLAELARAVGGPRVRLLPVPGIDLLLGGRVVPDQLARDRDTMFATAGWRAPE